MLRRLTIVAVSLVCAGSAQVLKPREKPADYAVRANLQHDFVLAADYLVHSVPSGTGNASDGMVANDYLVIEIGVFGKPYSKIDLLEGRFELKLNGKTTLTPDSPGTVAASIKFDDWNPRKTVELGGGYGNTTVVYGPSPRSPRFPGDPAEQKPPAPADDPGKPKSYDVPVSIDERIARVSLAPHELPTPAVGLLFFPYKGKTKSIKSLELIYEGPAGKASLKLE